MNAQQRMHELQGKIEEFRDLRFLAVKDQEPARGMYIRNVGLLPEHASAAVEAIRGGNVLEVQRLLDAAANVISL